MAKPDHDLPIERPKTMTREQFKASIERSRKSIAESMKVLEDIQRKRELREMRDAARERTHLHLVPPIEEDD
jgi:hypothetical protein